MPEIISVSTIDFEYRTPQKILKEFAREIFSGDFEGIDRLLEVFENANIENRNLCVPVNFFYDKKSFREKNDLYIKHVVRYSAEAAKSCLEKSGFSKKDVTDLIFISSTGLSTPSIDALIINELELDRSISRLPVWGLGCAGGAAGIAKANVIAKANKDAVVLLIAAELCSLTFIRDDISKSNFIATSLFSDGISAVLIAGDNACIKSKVNRKVKIIDSQSIIYHDTLDVMGWDILDDGFKVVFSKDIPSIVNQNVREDISSFLRKHNLSIEDIKNFVAHPGGAKVINAYIDSLNITANKLKNTKEVLNDYGNMSSASVLYVLERFMNKGFESGYGLITSLGPGFSLEMTLIITDS